MSHREKGDAFAKRVGEHLCRKGKLVKPEYSVEIGFRTDSRKRHSFDFGNETTLVECKNYDWTKGVGIPSAKISTLNESMLYFLAAPSSFRKILFLAEKKRKGVRGSETLAEYYVRQQGHLIPDDVEIWELSSDGGARPVERSVSFMRRQP